MAHAPLIGVLLRVELRSEKRIVMRLSQRDEMCAHRVDVRAEYFPERRKPLRRVVREEGGSAAVSSAQGSCAPLSTAQHSAAQPRNTAQQSIARNRCCAKPPARVCVFAKQ